jgi:hypothetical protein
MTTQSSGTSICQSCATLIRRPEEFGTDAAGHCIGAYCLRCFRDGRFVEPQLTREEMIRRVAEEMRLGGLSEYSATREIADAISKLGRWRHGGPEPPALEETPTQKTPRLVISRRNDRR